MFGYIITAIIAFALGVIFKSVVTVEWTKIETAVTNDADAVTTAAEAEAKKL